MALVLADRVKETTTTTGTGTVTLAGAVTGYQSFSAVGNANTTYYCIAGQTSSEWEVGIGTYTSVGTTLSRDTVLASSNAGSLVNFSAGTKDVFVTYPAGRSVYANGTVLTATNSSVLPVSSGGTGMTSATAYAVLCGGTTSTGAHQSIASVGTSGQVLTSNGAGALPTFQAAPAASLTITDDTSTNATRYLTFTSATTGSITSENVSSTKLTYNPSTGTLSATAVTASSDERLKKDWQDLPADFIERLATVKHGTYTRTDTEERHAGSSAQDWQKLLPEVVAKADDAGTLSLAYGNAALVSAIKLAERVVMQENRIAKLEALVAKLTQGGSE